MKLTQIQGQYENSTQKDPGLESDLGCEVTVLITATWSCHQCVTIYSFTCTHNCPIFFFTTAKLDQTRLDCKFVEHKFVTG